MSEEPLEMSNLVERISEEKETVENKVAQEGSQILNDILNFRAHFEKNEFITELVFGLGNLKDTLKGVCTIHMM